MGWRDQPDVIPTDRLTAKQNLSPTPESSRRLRPGADVLGRGVRGWVMFLLLVACDAPAVLTDAGVPADAEVPGDAAAAPPSTLGPAERPARLYVPPAHDGTTALPLVVLLHGYTVDATIQDLYFGLTRQARRGGFYVLLPDGTIDADGEPHWDVLGTNLDDHAYLRALIEEAMGTLPVDPGAVSLIGHSNGGFMAYRMACDSADLVTGIVSLAGSEASMACEPSSDVAVLQIHGTTDSTVSFDGGTIAGLDYGSATETVERWATRAGCEPSPTAGPRLDLVTDVDGEETAPTVYGGCRAGVELWVMEGVDHIPALTAEFTPSVLAWLGAHVR